MCNQYSKLLIFHILLFIHDHFTLIAYLNFDAKSALEILGLHLNFIKLNCQHFFSLSVAPILHYLSKVKNKHLQFFKFWINTCLILFERSYILQAMVWILIGDLSLLQNTFKIFLFIILSKTSIAEITISFTIFPSKIVCVCVCRNLNHFIAGGSYKLRFVQICLKIFVRYNSDIWWLIFLILFWPLTRNFL